MKQYADVSFKKKLFKGLQIVFVVADLYNISLEYCIAALTVNV